MFITYDRIREKTTSSGTGSLVLSSYAANYLRFSDVYEANTRFPYAIVSDSQFEVGIGYLDGSGLLVRETLLSSSNFTNVGGGVVTFTSVNFPVGTTKDVFVPAPTRLTPTINDNPTDNYSDDRFLVYGLNPALNKYEWQLKSLGDVPLLAADFLNKGVVFVDTDALLTDNKFIFDVNSTPALLTLTGNFFVDGNIKATSKSFSIKHPIKPGKMLNHGSLEGPEFGIYFRKTVAIFREKEIYLPDYFPVLAGKLDVFVSAQDGSRIAWEIDGSTIKLTRKGLHFSSTQVSVIVIGARKDCQFVLEE